MKSCTIILIVVSAVTLFLSNPANSQTGQQRTLPDSVFFNTLVAQYAQSVDQADTLLALKIWAPTDEISFFNPGGTAYGWKGVKNIYKMFHDNFSARKLNFYDVKFAYYGNVSWVTFFWTFNGTLKMNNNPVQTKGRETQIWRKVNYEWRLVHVHYSGLPVTDLNQGF